MSSVSSTTVEEVFQKKRCSDQFHVDPHYCRLGSFHYTLTTVSKCNQMKVELRTFHGASLGQIESILASRAHVPKFAEHWER
jgi:hypothetical protein